MPEIVFYLITRRVDAIQNKQKIISTTASLIPNKKKRLKKRQSRSWRPHHFRIDQLAPGETSKLESAREKIKVERGAGINCSALTLLERGC